MPASAGSRPAFPMPLVLVRADWSKAKLLYGLHTAAQFHQYAACWLGSTHIAAAAAGGTVFVFRLSDAKVAPHNPMQLSQSGKPELSSEVYGFTRFFPHPEM